MNRISVNLESNLLDAEFRGLEGGGDGWVAKREVEAAGRAT